MAHVCPWWVATFLDNPLRRLLHKPAKLLGPGLFSIAMAKLVGETGKVIAIDIQAKMLEQLEQKMRKANVTNIVLHKAAPDSLSSSKQVDFALAFYMVHEVNDQARFFRSAQNFSASSSICSSRS
jgi:ubiquinone/menaquinone biosynthesis C-methylase UbiE